MEISLCYIVGRLRASPSVLADARPHRSVLVVVVIVLKVRRVSIQQHVPVVIESIKHPKPHTAPKPEPNALCAKDASCSVTPSCVTPPPSLAYPRAEAQKGAARRGHGDATRRTRSPH